MFGLVLVSRLRAELAGTSTRRRSSAWNVDPERLVGVAFLLLAVYVAVQAVVDLASGERPDASPVGIVSPPSRSGDALAGRRQRRTGEALSSRA